MAELTGTCPDCGAIAPDCLIPPPLCDPCARVAHALGDTADERARLLATTTSEEGR